MKSEKIVNDIKFTEIQTMINLLTKPKSSARKELTYTLWNINSVLKLLESEKSENHSVGVRTDSFPTVQESENFSDKNNDKGIV